MCPHLMCTLSTRELYNGPSIHPTHKCPVGPCLPPGPQLEAPSPQDLPTLLLLVAMGPCLLHTLQNALLQEVPFLLATLLSSHIPLRWQIILNNPMTLHYSLVPTAVVMQL